MPGMAKTSALARPWQIAVRTVHTFSEIDGEQRAASFAYYAIFSLIPLIALLLSVGSMFFEPAAVKHAVAEFIPRDSPGQDLVWQMVDALQRARGGVSIVSLVILAWSSLKFFQALVRAVNHAWHSEDLAWWQLPLKNLAMIGITTSGFALGIILPAIVQGVTKALVAFEHFIVSYFPGFQIAPIFHALELGRYLVGGIVLLYTILMLYTFAPRRRVPWRHVWLPALSVAIALQLLQVALVNYLTRFVNYNAVYGPIGGLMLLLFWIYLSGVVIIFGACFSASLANPAKPARE